MGGADDDVLHGLFSCEEDVYNPLRFHQMALRWARIARDHGNADDDVLAWLDRFDRRTTEVTDFS